MSVLASILACTLLILILSCECDALKSINFKRVPYSLKEKNPFKFDVIADPPVLGAALIGGVGILSSLVCGYSLYILKTTSCGLPPGPFGLEGAFEGVSYLIVTGIFGWSAYKKIKTGSGLNTDALGLLGAAEGLAYLVVLGGIVVAGLNVFEFGFLPGFLPNDKCFGINS